MKLFLTLLLIINALMLQRPLKVSKITNMLLSNHLIYPVPAWDCLPLKIFPKTQWSLITKGKKLLVKNTAMPRMKKSEHWYMFTMPECANEPNFPTLMETGSTMVQS